MLRVLAVHARDETITLVTLLTIQMDTQAFLNLPTLRVQYLFPLPAVVQLLQTARPFLQVLKTFLKSHLLLFSLSSLFTLELAGFAMFVFGTIEYLRCTSYVSS
jgi:hypothetical protein